MCSYDTGRAESVVLCWSIKDGGRKDILVEVFTHLHGGEACCEHTGWH